MRHLSQRKAITALNQGLGGLACAVLWALLLFSLKATAEEPRWVQRHYGSIDGLPVGSASSGRIDADGFLWLATHDGLARFDGQRFEVYDSIRYPAMSGNRIISLHDDRQGRIFAFTELGEWLLVRSGHIESVPMGENASPQVRHVDPASLCLTTAKAMHCPDDAGRFPPSLVFPPELDARAALPGRSAATTAWAVTVDGAIQQLREGQWHQRLPASVSRQPDSKGLALVANDGAFWVGEAGNLTRVPENPSTAPLENIGQWGENKDSVQITQLREDSAGTIWITTTRGIFASSNGAPPRRIFVGNEAIGTELAYGFWLAPDGSLWFSRNGQLWRLESPPVAGEPLPPPVLSIPGVPLSMLFERDGTVWVMSLRDGVHRLNRARVDLLGDLDGVGSSNVYGISRQRDGTLWLGTLGDGLKAIAPDGQVHHFGRNDGLPGDNPWLVAAAPDDTVLVATYAPGLWQRSPHEDRFQPVALPDETRHAQTRAIVFDPAGITWIGTTSGAWKKTADGWQKQWPAQGQVRVNAMAFSNSGETWFGGIGVWRQQGNVGHAVAEQLLQRTSIRDLYRSHDGALWISTDGRGLVRVAADDPHGHHAVLLGRAEGLPSNSPHTVREDANGHLWVNSNQGIFRIAQNNLAEYLAGASNRLSPLVLGLADGLTELEGNGGVQPAAAFDTEGRLWFPSQRGVVRFDPLAMPLRTQPPHAVIDALESEGRTLTLEANTPLPSGVRSILIRYGAADLHAGAQVRFRYRLLPQDKGWTDAANGRTAGFAHLAPGTHRFELLAGNSDGVWAKTPTVLDIRVPHYWYETGWFHLAASLALALGLLAAVRWRTHRLNARAAQLDHEVRARTDELRLEKGRVETALAELSDTHQALARTHETIADSNQQLAEQARRLEAMDRFRSRVLADVSHELRTPVMLVSLPLRELQSQTCALTETDRRRLNLSLQQLDRLGGLVEQLVGLVQAESGQIRLRLVRIDLGALLENILAGFQPAAERVGVRLSLDVEQKPPALFGDRQHLITVFGNLIDNAIKYAPHGSTVSLHLICDDTQARVDVKDQGPGFDPALAAQLFERFFRVEGPPRHGREGLGIGLALARELVELHGGRIGATSSPGLGARFHVELPLGSAHVAVDDLALDATPNRSLPTTLPSNGNGRLLLVEDHPDLAAYLAERLGEHLPVTCVASVEDAMKALDDDGDIRLVVSDVVLPGQSGLELCRMLTQGEAAPVLPVVLISAKAGESDRAAGLAAGASAYLAKPFSFENLLQTIVAAWPAVASRFSVGPADADIADPLLRIALDALPNAQFDITQWAGQAHLSERQLRRRVNELTGQSPQTWLREQRLLRVRQLIRSGTCRTLAQAGSQAGLDNPAYLYRSYRARFGEH